ncbi:hypothetical protein MKX03_011111 [Papaver bracteatum]|nr:hypothetical protein MKX03_011111 [Papaver bracteatum]
MAARSSPSSAQIKRKRKRRCRSKEACTCCISYLKPTSEEDNEASKASRDSKMKELQLALQSDYVDLPKPQFRAICIKAAELEAYNRHPNCDRNDDKVRKDMHRSVNEEVRKLDQARRATTCARITAKRLLGVNKIRSKGVLRRSRFKPPKEYGGEQTFLRLDLGDEETEAESDFDKKLKTDENPMIIKLTGVTIFPKVDGQGGDTDVGTLEAHADEFIYSTSGSSLVWKLTCKYENVKEALFQVEDDKKMLPLLHFQLHHSIKVGTEKTKHIQFRLLPALVGKSRLDNDPDKFEEEKQTNDRGRSEDLKNFVDKINWLEPRCPFPFPFRGVYKEVEFHGVYKEGRSRVLPSNASDVFVLTLSLLVHVTDTPFFVVDLGDIEIVNLARLRPQEIDMTIVFKDFRCPVLQIGAIPLDSLMDIKRCLDFVGVKFYDNILDLNWNYIVKQIAKKPKTFVKRGGWDAYKLEGDDTSIYYRHYNLEALQGKCNLKAPTAVRF